MEVILIDGTLHANSETLKRIGYFEGFFRFLTTTTKKTNEIEFEVNCSTNVFQNFLHFVEENQIYIKGDEISELYNLASYFTYFDLQNLITFDCHKYFFLKDLYLSDHWLKEFYMHPNFEYLINSFRDVHHCLLINSPPGFRIRQLNPLKIPKYFKLSCQRSKYIPEDPKPALPQYYVLNSNLEKGAKKLVYYSRTCSVISDIREALQFHNTRHGNSQSRTGFNNNVSCRIIYKILEEEEEFGILFVDFLVSYITKKYPSFSTTKHSGKSWDFHINGGNSKEECAITITGDPHDMLNFFKSEKHHSIVKVSLRIHMSHFNKVFQYCSSLGYHPDSNTFFYKTYE